MELKSIIAQACLFLKPDLPLLVCMAVFSCMPAPPGQRVNVPAVKQGTGARADMAEKSTAPGAKRVFAFNDKNMTRIDSLNRGKEVTLKEDDFWENVIPEKNTGVPGKQIKKASTKDSENGPTSWVKGYQVQVLTAENSREAEAGKAELERILKMKVNIVYNAPYFKLRVGRFTNHDKAMDLKEKLLEMGYEGVWVVRTKVLAKSR